MLENFTAGMYNEAKRWRNSYKLLVYRYYTILQMSFLHFCCVILYLFATYNLALVNSSVFWIFVVIMQLNTKWSLIATKHLVYFWSQNVLTTCYIECFSELCTYTIFWPSHISWCIAKCLTEGRWSYTDKMQYKWNRFTVQETSSDALLFSAHLQLKKL